MTNQDEEIARRLFAIATAGLEDAREAAIQGQGHSRGQREQRQTARRLASLARKAESLAVSVEMRASAGNKMS
jgi:hypothetical protein